MTSALLGEFLGTMVLILLGNGVVAGVLLKKTKAEGSGWMVITTGWAFAVMAGVFTAIACGSSDAHLNPAVTLGFAVRAGDFAKVAPYLGAQLLGGFAGGALVWLHYLPHWRVTEDKAAKLACFCTSPAIRSFGANLLSEIIATFVLVFVVGAIFSKSVAIGGLAAGLGPYLVGSLVWGIGLSLGGTTGYAINPARDFGPRVAHAILPVAGKGGSDWSYGVIAIVGPLIGGGLAGWAMRVVGVF
jgi:glycerol uptake facilitator protein